jgi:ferredoxin
VSSFSLFDPLMALTTMVASRQIIAGFAPAIVTVLVTLALGRVWCGWICPLGAILNLFGPNGRTRVPERLRQAKYVLLLLILLPAFLGSLTLMFLDPLCVFVRALGGTVYPAIQRVIGSSAQVQRPILPVLAIPFLIVLGLNLIARRFWCRYLCPLGALLGLLSRFSWIKRRVDRNVCKKWGDCVEECPMGTISKEDFTSDPAECIMCLDCKPPCPVGAVSFGKQPTPSAAPEAGRSPSLGPGHEYGFSRRQFLASLGVGAAWAGLLSTGMAKQKSPHVLRPPGATESEFLSKCVRCAQCVKVCPNSALQPSLFEGGLEGFWSPILVPRVGNCDYDCNACGQVCPSGAIPPLSLEEKRKAVIGTAFVDRNRCISCMICESECPVHAIVEVMVDGIKFPQVMPDLCIGCGTCEYECPVEGEAAIRVYARGDYCPSRLLLPPLTEETKEPEKTEEPEPEGTKEPEPEETEETGGIAYVDQDVCIRCMLCVKNCPDQAIKEVQVGDLTFPEVMPELCTGCGTCEEICPVLPDRGGPAIRVYAPEDYPG